MLNSLPKATHLGSRIRTLAPPVVVRRHLSPTPHPAGPSQMLPWMQPIPRPPDWETLSGSRVAALS